MIIVKTKNGDVFINEKEYMEIRHLKDACKVVFHQKDEGTLMKRFPDMNEITDVEQVRYLSDIQAIDYIDKGNKLERYNELVNNFIAMIKLLKENLSDFQSMYRSIRIPIDWMASEDLQPKDFEDTDKLKDLSRGLKLADNLAEKTNKRYYEMKELDNELEILYNAVKD